MPICNSSYHDLVWYAELRIGILLKVCRFVIRHITQTDTEMETELLRRHKISVHPEKLRLRLRIPPQIEKKNTVDMLTDGILQKM